MKLFHRSASMLLVLLAMACGSAGDPPTRSEEVNGAHPRVMRLAFSSDHAVPKPDVIDLMNGAQSTHLGAGPLDVSVDPARLSKCGPTAEVDLFYRMNGGAATQAALAGSGSDPRTAKIPLTAPGSLELWLRGTNTSGCVEWDSRDGANYKYNVLRAGGEVLTFKAGAAPSLSGPIRAGSAVSIDYDRSRIHVCDSNGQEGGSFIQLSYRLDDGPIQHASSGNFVMGGQMPDIEVPLDAHELTMWFVSQEDATHCGPFYDSNSGKNFVFEVKP